MNERSSFPDRPRDETERSFLEGRDYNMKKLVKTNVMRLLDAAKIAYEAKEYPVDENDLSGSHAADLMGVDHGSVFKTLVLRGEKTGYMAVSYTHLTLPTKSPGRLFSHRDEKEIPHLSGQVGRGV